jgi:hypothetical protein
MKSDGSGIRMTLGKRRPATLVTLCYQKAGRAVARVVARDLERTVHSEHSGAQVLLSVQVACPERCPGLLVMRKSPVRIR